MKPSEVLDHLIRFAEDPEEVAAMTPEQINSYLAVEGVDVEAEAVRLYARLSQIASPGEPCPSCGGSGRYWNGLLEELRPCIDCVARNRVP